MNGAAQDSAPVYLDYAATTPVDARVASRMAECLTRDGAFGNPGSASHSYGEAASAVVEAARAEVAAAVGATPGDVLFTSGATEANNLAVFGVANYYREAGRHLVTVRTEHKSVLDPCRELERRGWRVTYLNPDQGGRLDPAQVESALRPDTVLVSVMHVNNEIGVVQDIGAIAAVCSRQPHVRLHVDAAQSVGKLAVDFSGAGIDSVACRRTRHTVPRGSAPCLHRAGAVCSCNPCIGGAVRSAICDLALWPHIRWRGWGPPFSWLPPTWAKRRSASHGCAIGCGGVSMHSAECCATATVRKQWPICSTCRSRESKAKSARGGRSAIAVSTGSACTSAVQEPSYALRALGRDERLAESSVRFSLGRFSPSRTWTRQWRRWLAPWSDCAG